MNDVDSNRNQERRARSGRGVRRRLAALACAGALVMAPATSFADDAAMAKDAGMGFGSAVASLLYTPVKMSYALGGVLVGGLAWAFSGGDADVARIVLEPSVLGDYVVTTSHLTGQDQIEFFGRHDAAQADAGYQDRYRETPPESDVASAPDGW